MSIYQNERWAYPTSSQISSCGGNVTTAGWKGGPANLKPSDRGAWTKGGDGSITVGEDPSRIMFELEDGWKFVDTEEWEPDYMARWATVSGADRGTSMPFEYFLEPFGSYLQVAHRTDLPYVYPYRWLGVYERCMARSSPCSCGRMAENRYDKKTEMDKEDISATEGIASVTSVPIVSKRMTLYIVWNLLSMYCQLDLL